MIKSEKSIMNVSLLENIAKDILNEAARLGAHQAEVGIATNKGFSVTARDCDVETVEYNQDKVIDVHVYFGQRAGSASISDIRPQAIKDAVEAACHIAKFTDTDPASGLAEKEELGFDYPKLELATSWGITEEQAIELACECEKLGLAYDKRIMSAEEATVATGDALHLYANSNGFMGSYAYTRHEISCILVAKQGEEMQRDYSYTVSSDPAQLESIKAIATEAAKKAVSRLGARRLPTMKAPVLYIAEEARSLLRYFASAISGNSIYRRSSFLLDQLDKQIFPHFVRLQEHPHLPHGLGSAPFDNEGVATRDNLFVEDGILRNYSLSVYTGRKLGMKTTGNAGGIHNLSIITGNNDLPTLIKNMDRGLLVTETMGQGVNMVTGDYSRGVGGFWIEHGEIQYPVHEVTVAGNLKNMFMRFAEIGNDIDTRGSIRTGSILLEEMTIAGS